MQFAHALHRPKVKSRLATHFNQVVQADLFFLWDRVFIIVVDECLRDKFADELKDRSYESILECLQKGWFRYFGPPVRFFAIKKGHSLATPSPRSATNTRSIGGWLVLIQAILGEEANTPPLALQRSTSTC